MDLAHQPALKLGSLDIRPSTREIIVGARREIVEPRVMAVLVFLAQASGRVVTREELTEACWQGRIVSDDAINRVISRVRRVSEFTGGRDFTLETITKVGYRLLASAEGGDPAPGGDVAPLTALAGSAAAETRAEAPTLSAPRRLSRRLLLAVGAGAIAASGAIVWRLGQSASRPTRAVELYRRAIEIGATDDAKGIAQSISFLREAVELAPGYADAWAGLALAYGYGFATNPPEKHASLIARAKDAATRALALDPRNADALGALSLLPPIYQRWQAAEIDYRAALARRPPNAPIDRALGELLASTGRLAESVPHAEKALAHTPLIARRHFEMALVYWYSGRLDDADRTIEKAYELWPLDISVWFGRLYQRMHGGNLRGALDMLSDSTGHPPGVPASDFQLVEAAARALQSGAPADRIAAIALNLAAARDGLGYARNAVLVASALRDLDAAFEAANAYFFDKPFAVAQTYFTREQGEYLGVRSRETTYLFSPPLVEFRADPRFENLVATLGLDDFWRSTGEIPDYRRARTP